MPYYEFEIKTPEESREAITNRLMELGSTGFFESDGKIFAYFDAKKEIRNLCGELDRFRNILKESGLDPDFSYSFVPLPDRDWNEEWKKSFVPFTIGDSFTVLPPWEKDHYGRIDIIIDPGMAFGTGHHETTRTCLMMVEKYSREKKSFLDVGTGTGILAIGAAKLGISRVMGIDNDPVAVDAARHNLELNGLARVQIRECSLSAVKEKSDLIAANLISVTLIEIAAEIAVRLDQDGTAVLSGILVEQGDEVVQAMAKAGLVLKEEVVDGKWITLVVNKGLLSPYVKGNENLY